MSKNRLVPGYGAITEKRAKPALLPGAANVKETVSTVLFRRTLSNRVGARNV